MSTVVESTGKSPVKIEVGIKLRGAEKVARIPVKIIPTDESIEVMKRMCEHDIDMLTLGQYLQPSRSHLPAQRFVHPDVFACFAEDGARMGFKNVASGPLVRSSYHAEQQLHGSETGLKP